MTEYQRQVKKLDDLFSLIVRTRANWRCEQCGRNCFEDRGYLQCSHIFSRKHFNTRWDFENALALCRACHLYGAHSGDLAKIRRFMEVVEGKLGKKRLEALEVRSGISVRGQDLKLVELYLKKEANLL